MSAVSMTPWVICGLTGQHGRVGSPQLANMVTGGLRRSVHRAAVSMRSLSRSRRLPGYGTVRHDRHAVRPSDTALNS